MLLHRVTLRLARNPTEPDGDPRRGYVLMLPLDGDGKIDIKRYEASPSLCTVNRFAPGAEDDAEGFLRRTAHGWVFVYDTPEEGPEEPIAGFEGHSLNLNDYLSISHRGGPALTYQVTEKVELHTAG
jgi:hypothetical protein